jgi:hypothetical protein
MNVNEPAAWGAEPLDSVTRDILLGWVSGVLGPEEPHGAAIPQQRIGCSLTVSPLHLIDRLISLTGSPHTWFPRDKSDTD